MAQRTWKWISIPVVLVAVVSGGFVLAEYLAQAEQRRDDQRRAAVEQVERTLDRRGAALPDRDGSLSNERGLTKATGGLAAIGSVPDRPKDTVIHYAVSSASKAYFVCTSLERGGAFYANRHGTFSGPAESCKPDADPAAVEYVLDTKMTSDGAGAFLRSNPAFVSKQFIQRKCAATADDGQLQGCFTGDRIYLIDLPDQAIRPEVSVTAAHEMLHAVWEGLADEERRRLTRLLEELIRKDPVLRERTESYDENSRLNEAHSIAGTEVGDVGDELERHYAKYLRDRALVVRRHVAYETLIDDLGAEIERLKREFTAYEAEGRRLLDAGDIDAYNSFVSEYNARAPGMVAAINAKVDRFNRLTEHTRPDGRVPTVDAR